MQRPRRASPRPNGGSDMADENNTKTDAAKKAPRRRQAPAAPQQVMRHALPELPPIPPAPESTISEETNVKLQNLLIVLRQRNLDCAVSLAQEAAAGRGELGEFFGEIGRRFGHTLEHSNVPLKPAQTKPKPTVTAASNVISFPRAPAEPVATPVAIEPDFDGDSLETILTDIRDILRRRGLRRIVDGGAT